MPVYEDSSINFITEKSNKLTTSKGLELFLTWASHTGKHILVGIEAIVLICLAVDFYLSRNITLTKNTISGLNLAINQPENQRIVQEYKVMQQDLITIEQNVKNQINWAFNLNEINTKVPENLIIESITYDNSKVLITGNVKSPQGFGTFIENLINDERVESITLNRSVYDTATTTFTFDLELILTASALKAPHVTECEAGSHGCSGAESVVFTKL